MVLLDGWYVSDVFCGSQNARAHGLQLPRVFCLVHGGG